MKLDNSVLWYNYALPANWIQTFRGNMVPSSLRVVISKNIPIFEDQDTTVPRNIVVRLNVDAIYVKGEWNPELYRYENLKTRTACRFMSVCKNWLLLHVPSQMNRVHNFTSYTFRSISVSSSHLQLDLRSSVFFKDIQTQPVCIPYLSHTRAMFLQFYSPWLDHSNDTRWSVQATNDGVL
jgi:hypothetical protein